jgi:hypothetical protein
MYKRIRNIEKSMIDASINGTFDNRNHNVRDYSGSSMSSPHSRNIKRFVQKDNEIGIRIKTTKLQQINDFINAKEASIN